MSKKQFLLGIALMMVMVGTSAPAVEAQETGERAFELYAGYLVPGERELENDTTWGIRYTSRNWDQFGWQISVGYMDLGIEGGPDLSDFIHSASGYFGDATGIWYPAGSDFGIFAGLGYGAVDVDLEGTTTDESDSGLTYVYGANYTWNFGESYLLKPEVRWRTWDGDFYGSTDTEYTLAFGWRF